MPPLFYCFSEDEDSNPSLGEGQGVLEGGFSDLRAAVAAQQTR